MGNSLLLATAHGPMSQMRQSSMSDEDVDVAVFKPVISTYQPVLFSSQMKHMTKNN